MYLLIDPAAIEITGDLKRDRERLRKLSRHLAVLGQLAHSELLDGHRITLLTTRSLLARLLKIVRTYKAELQTELSLVRKQVAKAFSNMRCLDELPELQKNENLDVSVAGFDGTLDDDLLLALACLTWAVQKCSNPKATERTVFVISGSPASLTIRVPTCPTPCKIAAVPSLAHAGHIVPKKQCGLPLPGNRLLIHTEDANNWKTGTRSAKEVARSLDKLVGMGKATTKMGKGDHRYYFIKFDYLPWRAQFGDELKRRAIEVGKAEERFDLDYGKPDMPASFAFNFSPRLGLGKARTWWLVHGGQRGECRRRLCDVLTN